MSLMETKDYTYTIANDNKIPYDSSHIHYILYIHDILYILYIHDILYAIIN